MIEKDHMSDISLFCLRILFVWLLLVIAFVEFANESNQTVKKKQENHEGEKKKDYIWLEQKGISLLVVVSHANDIPANWICLTSC